MYELRIERTFCAAHAITIGGEREPLHGHNWRVRVVVSGERLDENDLLVDFHQLERDLDAILAPLRDQHLNETAMFQGVNPTAERVAERIASALRAKLPERVSLERVSVTEAPGCEATYRR